ncbi:MAG: hypothetical protein ACRDZM_11020 [Acidimicrobiia bacterium]
MLRLTSLSFAHPVVASDHRSALSLAGDDLESAHGRLARLGLPTFLMSTCLRVEIAWAGGPEWVDEVMTSLYGSAPVPDIGVIRQDEEAFAHLCRIAAGLDSPVVGEPEVLVQFRHAVAVANESSRGMGSLGKVLEAAVGVGRTARRRMEPAPAGSLATLAADAAATFERVAVLGAGAMARAAAGQLDGAEVSVFSRRPANVAGIETRPWAQALDAIATYPAVISTIPGTEPLFPGVDVGHSLSRREAPLLLIDLGMPPGFGRPAGMGPVSYMGVDEVASSVSNRPPAEMEEHVIDSATSAWRHLASSDLAGEVIATMLSHAETAVTEEVERFAARLAAAPDPEPVLRQLAHTVARRVLHPPISYIGSAEQQTVEMLAKAFGVKDG